MFKISKNLSPDIVREIFQERSVPYNLRSDNNSASRHVNSVYHGTESLSFLGPKIWEQVPPELKALESLDIFKRQIKKMDTFKLSMQIMSYLSSSNRFYLKLVHENVTE